MGNSNDGGAAKMQAALAMQESRQNHEIQMRKMDEEFAERRRQHDEKMEMMREQFKKDTEERNKRHKEAMEAIKVN